MASFIPQLIIPAAGFGKRVGSPKAKELMLDPEGRPLIENALGLAQKNEWPILVITRKDKLDLIEYLQLKQKGYPHLQIHLIESSSEWPDTLLQAKHLFTEKNILVLPDTRFSPTSILQNISLHLDTYALCFATFFTLEPLHTWGVIQKMEDQYFICEKPTGPLTPVPASLPQPWGLIGFKKSEGIELFQKILQSGREHHWLPLNTPITTITLDHFSDLTR